jgi:hypothetical protein
MFTRIPPPPFWRTRYFAEKVVNKPDRADISPGEIEITIRTPDHRVVQLDGRVRYWRWVAARGRWLRVITEADGETVHNAFWDRGFRP